LINESKLNYKHIGKLDIAIPLFTRAIEKSAESLDNQIDKVIKEQFTAVQPSVEWKFTEAAYNFIIQKQQGKDPKPERIAFESCIRYMALLIFVIHLLKDHNLFNSISLNSCKWRHR
jgi:hypothetical protein